MFVEITILSGARQGERLTLESSSLVAGDQPGDAIYFAPTRDPQVRGRRVELRREDEGWRLRNLNGGDVLINRAVVVDAMPLRSGDIVRLSPAGPDFSFVLGHRRGSAPPAALHETPPASATPTHPTPGRQTAVAPPALLRRAVEARPHGGAEAGEVEDDPVVFESVESWASWFWGAGLLWYQRPVNVTGLILLAVLLVILLQVLSSPAALPPLRLPAYAERVLTEGELLELSFAAVEGATPGRALLYRLASGAPQGVQLDPHSGLLRWQPAAHQASRDYRLTVSVQAVDATQPGSATTTFAVRVVARDRPPVFHPLADQRVDVRQRTPLKVVVAAVDPNEPPAPLRFSLEGPVPPGLQINPQSGLIHWQPDPSLAGQSYRVTVRAREETAAGLSTSQEFRLSLFESDPWQEVEQRSRESVFLLVGKVEGTGQAFPISTVCAVGPRLLLTSAQLATELTRRHEEGLRLSAVNLASEQGTGHEYRVLEVLVPKYYHQLAEGSVEQLYFDLALLKVGADLPRICPLAEPEKLDRLSPTSSLRCMLLPSGTDWLIRLSAGQAELVPAEVRSVERLPLAQQASPRLLRLGFQSSLTAYGAPILNERGHLVAVYSRPVPGQPQQHYAAWTLSQQRLNRLDADFWVPAATGSDETN